MLPFYSINFVGMVVFAIFFYRVGVFENSLIYQADVYRNCRGFPLFWAALSVAISLLIGQWLKWGLLGMFFGQIGLFVGIVVFRVIRKS